MISVQDYQNYDTNVLSANNELYNPVLILQVSCQAHDSHRIWKARTNVHIFFYTQIIKIIHKKARKYTRIYAIHSQKDTGSPSSDYG